MTISDDERREVAARLRALEPWAHFDVGDPIFRKEFEEALGLEYVIGDSYDAVDIRRLADLIDRPTRCMKMTNNDERRKEVQRLCAMAAVPSYELVSVRPSDLMKWANLIERSEVEFKDYLFEIYDWAYCNMECCDEPEWSLFSCLYDVIGRYFNETKCFKE